ncbi:nucleotide sugar dehydrogenase [Paenibacillus sp. 2KB_22]|uniref:nucleotide sugar dehydrogenase n=1 Tax=Paenibacillus sp. 2KB_22 TaxID=3232978 RepID=UPI003F99D009
MELCVIGLGYIGLPTAIMFAKHNIHVHGVDVNQDVINSLTSGRIHIVEPGLQNMLDDVMLTKSLSFGVKPKFADAFIISVPTPIRKDKRANLDYVIAATKSIVPFLKKGDLVVLESTVPPRTVEDIMLPILGKTGLEIGEDLFVSHSPERVLPGRLLEELVNNDRIVGGINELSSSKTADLYKTFVKGTIHLTNATTAEMVKLMENTYRDVNIAFANEMAKIAEQVGFNVWEAIELANCHPRVNIHRPGPGVGGHCIAVDPWFIYEAAPASAELIHKSRILNDSMPEYIVTKLNRLLEGFDQPTIAIMGLAFKGNIDDMRESPAVEIIEKLQSNYNVTLFDPHVKENVEGKMDTIEKAVENADVIVVLTDHNEFKGINPVVLFDSMKGDLVVDTRNVLDSDLWINAGFKVHSLGKSSVTTDQLTVEYSK